MPFIIGNTKLSFEVLCHTPSLVEDLLLHHCEFDLPTQPDRKKRKHKSKKKLLDSVTNSVAGSIDPHRNTQSPLKNEISCNCNNFVHGEVLFMRKQVFLLRFQRVFVVVWKSLISVI